MIFFLAVRSSLHISVVARYERVRYDPSPQVNANPPNNWQSSLAPSSPTPQPSDHHTPTIVLSEQPKS